jgi:hypothetical protein
LTWPLKFRRLRDGASKDSPPTANPTPPPPSSSEAPEEPTSKSIKLSPSQATDLTRSLRAKVSRVLKDLSLDAPGANTPAIVGGKNRPKKSSPPLASPKDPSRKPNA